MLDILQRLWYYKNINFKTQGGGQNDKLYTDKINCRFVRYTYCINYLFMEKYRS